jgi:hypothetical protein
VKSDLMDCGAMMRMFSVKIAIERKTDTLVLKQRSDLYRYVVHRPHPPFFLVCFTRSAHEFVHINARSPDFDSRSTV